MDYADQVRRMLHTGRPTRLRHCFLSSPTHMLQRCSPRPSAVVGTLPFPLLAMLPIQSRVSTFPCLLQSRRAMSCRKPRFGAVPRLGLGGSDVAASSGSSSKRQLLLRGGPTAT